MIIANMIGGLGNQLFQFACGWSLARRLGVPLRVCTRQFANYRLHNGFELARVFDVAVSEATDDELGQCLGFLGSLRLRSLVSRMTRRWGGIGNLVVEPTVYHWAGIANVRAPAYLSGYWQTEKYFEDHGRALRSVLNFRVPPSEENQRWLDDINGCESIGVHVRRGDYITNRKNSSVYYICPEAYYFAAIAQVRRTVPDSRVFVFSDDPQWAREKFAGLDCLAGVVDHNLGLDSYNDMRLMSACRHIVGSNSSFSWWAAWLGDDRLNRQVIFPPHWLRAAGQDRDMVPDRWLRFGESGFLPHRAEESDGTQSGG